MWPSKLPQLAYTLVALGTGLIFFRGSHHDYRPARDLWLLHATGYFTICLLIASLFTTPFRGLLGLSQPERRIRLGGLRRALGLSAAVLASVHATLVLAIYLPFSNIGALKERAFLQSGALAWALLVALFLTSFRPLIKYLQVKSWSALHRLSYLAALVACQHLLLSPGGDRRLGLGLFALTLTLILLRPILYLARGNARAPK